LVSGICKLKPKLKTKKNLFLFFKKPMFSSPVCDTNADARSGCGS